MGAGDRERWDGRYVDVEEPGAVKDLLTTALAGRALGRALDVACGLGASTLWMAEQGWTVDAVDVSPVAIEMVTARSPSGLVTAVAHDLDQGLPAAFAGPYDAIVCLAFRAVDLHGPLLDRLAGNGVLVASALSVVGRASDADKPRSAFLAEPGELARWATGLEVVRHQEADGLAELVAIKS